jgi:hypothetical protein
MQRPLARRPNFLLLGAAKSGTTSLAHYLAQHPDLCFSDPKEPIFFEAEYERGLDSYWETYFSSWNGERAVGEGRVYNLFLPFVSPRIWESLPDARLIAILRDPVMRAYSHWWHRFSRGLEKLSFPDAIEENLSQLEGGLSFEGREGERLWRRGLYRNTHATRYRLYLELGLYAEQLERYLALFPTSRLRVFLYEDLVTDAAAVVRDLWRFVGIDPGYELRDNSAQNERRDARTAPAAARLIRTARALELRRLVPRALRERALALVPERRAERPPVESAAREQLGRFFEPHNRALARLLDRDLSHWPEAVSRPPSLSV